MTPKYRPILLYNPPKNIQKIFIFLKPQKILKLKILDPKNDPSQRTIYV